MPCVKIVYNLWVFLGDQLALNDKVMQVICYLLCSCFESTNIEHFIHVKEICAFVTFGLIAALCQDTYHVLCILKY